MAEDKTIFNKGNVRELEYLFYSVNATTSNHSDEKRAFTPILHLPGKILNYYAKTFTTNEVLFDEGKSYKAIRKKLITDFATAKELQKAIEVAHFIKLKSRRSISDFIEDVENVYLDAEFTAERSL